MAEEYGTLMVRTYTAGALPVEEAVVRIKGADETNRTVVYSLVTDLDGVSETVTLPAPPKALSESPDTVGIPYSLYDVEVYADGYYPKRIYGVTVFSGVKTLIELNMIPTSENPDDYLEDYPRGNVNSVVPPNSDLE